MPARRGCGRRTKAERGGPARRRSGTRAHDGRRASGARAADARARERKRQGPRAREARERRGRHHGAPRRRRQADPVRAAARGERGRREGVGRGARGGRGGFMGVSGPFSGGSVMERRFVCHLRRVADWLERTSQDDVFEAPGPRPKRGRRGKAKSFGKIKTEGGARRLRRYLVDSDDPSQHWRRCRHHPSPTRTGGSE